MWVLIQLVGSFAVAGGDGLAGGGGGGSDEFLDVLSFCIFVALKERQRETDRFGMEKVAVLGGCLVVGVAVLSCVCCFTLCFN